MYSLCSCPAEPSLAISHLINIKATMLLELKAAFAERVEEMAQSYVDILELKARSGKTSNPNKFPTVNSFLMVFPTITRVYIALSNGYVPACFQLAVIHPLIKKPNLDRSIPDNYRPISVSLEKLIFYEPFLERNLHTAAFIHYQSRWRLNSSVFIFYCNL